MEMNRADMDLLLDAEDELNRQAHQEEVDEMRLAREFGEYDCGEDDENCPDCDWADCPNTVAVKIGNVKPAVNQSQRRRERRKRANLRQAGSRADPKPLRVKKNFVAPNYQAYLNYSRSRRPLLKAEGHGVRDCNAIIFEQWHRMDVDQKIPFYEKVIDR